MFVSIRLAAFHCMLMCISALAMLEGYQQDVEDTTHPPTRMLGGSWPLAEEFYQFGTAVWDAHVLGGIRWTLGLEN